MSDFSIFGLTSSLHLAAKVGEILDRPAGKIDIRQFSDKEWYLEFAENVRDRNVVLIQSTNAPIDNLWVLCMAARAARGSAASVTAVMPYFGYARQERTAEKRTPIAARLSADLLAASGVNRFILMDLHKGSIEGFFDPFCKVDHIYARRPMIEAMEGEFADDILEDRVVLVSPDVGALPMVRSYSRRFSRKLPYVVIDKDKENGRIKEMILIGEVRGKRAIIIDDIADSLGTGCGAAELLLESGAVDVSMAAVHPVLSGPALDNLGRGLIKRMFVTDSIEHGELPSTVRVVGIAGLLAEAIKRSANGGSLRELMA